MLNEGTAVLAADGFNTAAAPCCCGGGIAAEDEYEVSLSGDVPNDCVDDSGLLNTRWFSDSILDEDCDFCMFGLL